MNKLNSNKVNNDELSVDEVDSVITSTKSAENKDTCKSCGKAGSDDENKAAKIECNKTTNNNNVHSNKKTFAQDRQSDEGPVKSQCSAFKALNIFNLSKFHKRSENKDKNDESRHKQVVGQRLIRSSSLAKLLGNGMPILKNSDAKETVLRKSHSVHERFSKRSEDSCEDDEHVAMRSLDRSLNKCVSSLENTKWSNDISNKKLNNFDAFKTLTRNFGKLLRKNYDSVSISDPDPEYKVSYLGNVLTAWSKGESCIEKPLATLWKNYTQNKKPEVLMRLRVCPSGLKATTHQHGLTEYWSHRITFCAAPQTYPKVFCWIYRHEGRKMKHELRCHAVICTKDSQCQEINIQLKENLEVALREFKKDKINKQNARLGLAHASEENPSMPRRKIMLSTGAQNYRPPLERSKSAPKLFAIEEMVDEEDEEDLDEESKMKRLEQKNQKEMIRPCCKEDHLYPSITLGRRRCRRGHSIRRPRLQGIGMKVQPKLTNIKSAPAGISTKEPIQKIEKLPKEYEELLNQKTIHLNENYSEKDDSPKTVGSDEDFENFLRNQNYETNEYLTVDMISYFDKKLSDSTSEINADPVTVSMSDLLSSNDYLLQEQQRNSISMNDLNNYHYSFESDDDDCELLDNKHFDQDKILQTLIQRSDENFGEIDSPDNSMISDDSHIPELNECRNMFVFNRQQYIDAVDDSSIDSEMKPILKLHRIADIPANNDKSEISYDVSQNQENLMNNLTVDEGREKSEESPVFRSGSVLDRVRNFEMMASGRLNIKESNNNATLSNNCFMNFNRNHSNLLNANNREMNLARRTTPVDNIMVDGRDKNRDDESEMSDESGFVEFQDLSLKSVYA